MQCFRIADEIEKVRTAETIRNLGEGKQTPVRF